MEKRNPTQHRMTRRCAAHDYTAPGIYHITMHVADALGRPFGTVVGSLAAPDGSADAPRVALSPIGQMVEHELLHAIPSFYPMIEIQDYVIMPEHLHFIIEVHDAIITRNGHPAHLGQVIAGFKKGCNKRFWEMTGQQGKPVGTAPSGLPAASAPSGLPAFGPSDPASEALGPADPVFSASAPLAIPAFGSSAPASEALGPAAPVFSASAPLVGSAFGSSAPASLADPASAALGLSASIVAASVAGVGAPAVFPQEVRAPFKVPSRCTSGRAPLFAAGYCDVMPLRGGQLATQRAYIAGNPRSRLLRSGSRSLHVQRGGIATALTPAALCGFLRRECGAAFTPAAWEEIRADLLMAPDGIITCDTFGDRALLTARRCLPVVCHRKDAARFGEQKQRCLTEAARGAVLVSARIAKGEQAIMDEALHGGFPVVLIADNGFPDRYHPSADRLDQCMAGRLLLISPWQYHYRGNTEQVTVLFCKTMNCVAQALCHTKDNWWKNKE